VYRRLTPRLAPLVFALVTAGLVPVGVTPLTAAPSTETVQKSSAKARRARAAARARRARELAQPRFKVNEAGERVPDVRAAAAIIYNPETDEVVWEANSQNERSIASITKVMTAAVVLEDNPDLTREVKIARSDVYRASHTYLRAGERVTLDDRTMPRRAPWRGRRRWAPTLSFSA
jgi:D-alanyl-D-alanine carboxypeptidase